MLRTADVPGSAGPREFTGTVEGVRSPRSRLWRLTPLPVLLAVTGVTFLLGWLQKRPCQEAGWRGYDVMMGKLCYSDIPLLYRDRAFGMGEFAYAVVDEVRTLEYPVLTGLFADVLARLSRWLLGVDAAQQDIEWVSLTYFEVNVLALTLLGLVAVWATARTAANPWHALMMAAAPSLAVAATINWDMLAVALTALALLTWARGRAVLAGVFIGLGVAAKLYTVFLLWPLLVLCLRTGRLREFWRTTVAAAVAWAAVNLPVLVISPAGWWEFWSFNSERGAEFGSLWYGLQVAGYPVPHLNPIAMGLLIVVCLGIGALALWAPRRPRLTQLAFLTVAAFLLLNKVYSPQYVLWLLPLVVLARPDWRDVVIWQFTEMIYWVAVWRYIGGYFGEELWLYWGAIGIRIAGTLYLVILVVRDILAPDHDPVRRSGADDPAGGVFNWAVDRLRGFRPVPRRTATVA